MASKSGSFKATPIVGPGSCSCKDVVDSAPPISRSNSKSDELGAPEKGSPAPNHASIPASSHASTSTLAESTLALKYSKTDLMKILKIFSETKGQKPKAEVPCKRPLKAKVPDVYFGKLHIDCYYFCQKCEDHFETVGATGLNRTPFATSFFHGKINFRWYQY